MLLNRKGVKWQRLRGLRPYESQAARRASWHELIQYPTLEQVTADPPSSQELFRLGGLGAWEGRSQRLSGQTGVQEPTRPEIALTGREGS